MTSLEFRRNESHRAALEKFLTSKTGNLVIGILQREAFRRYSHEELANYGALLKAEEQGARRMLETIADLALPAELDLPADQMGRRYRSHLEGARSLADALTPTNQD